MSKMHTTTVVGLILIKSIIRPIKFHQFKLGQRSISFFPQPDYEQIGLGQIIGSMRHFFKISKTKYNQMSFYLIKISTLTLNSTI